MSNMTLTKTKISVQQKVIATIAVTCAVAVGLAFATSGYNAYSSFSRGYIYFYRNMVNVREITAGQDATILKFKVGFRHISGFLDWNEAKLLLRFSNGASNVIGKATFKLVDSDGNVLDSVVPTSKMVMFHPNYKVKNGDQFSVVVSDSSTMGDSVMRAYLYGFYSRFTSNGGKVRSYGAAYTGGIITKGVTGIAPGSRDNKVATITLNADKLGGKHDEIIFNKIQAQLNSTGLTHDNIYNVRLVDGDTELALSNDPNPTSSSDGPEIITFKFRDPLVVKGGQAKKLDIVVDLAASARGGSFSFVFSDDTMTEANSASLSSVDSSPVDVIVEDSKPGKLMISRTDSYNDCWLTGNTDGLSVGKFNLVAQDNDIEVKMVVVNLNSFNGGGGDEITDIYLYDGSTMIDRKSPTSSNQEIFVFDIPSQKLVIDNGQQKEITIKVDTAVIANDGTPTIATATQGFQPVIKSGGIVAKSVNSGKSAEVNSTTLTFPKYGVVKSRPTVTILSTGDILNYPNEYELVDVTVTADSKGPIGLYKMTFEVTTTSADAYDFKVYEHGTLVATEGRDGIKVSHIYNPSGNYALVEVYFNNGGMLGGRLRQIFAGSSKTYTLRASVIPYGRYNGVSVSMLGDNGADSVDYYATADTIDNTSDNDFIWSDLSYGNTSTTATSTAEWLNGYMLDTAGGFLPTTSSAKSI